MNYRFKEPKYRPTQTVCFERPKTNGLRLEGQIQSVTTTWNDDLTSSHQYLIRTLPGQDFWQGYLSENQILKSL